MRSQSPYERNACRAALMRRLTLASVSAPATVVCVMDHVMMAVAFYHVGVRRRLPVRELELARVRDHAASRVVVVVLVVPERVVHLDLVAGDWGG